MNFKYEKDEANKYLISNVINEKNYKLYKRKYNNYNIKYIYLNLMFICFIILLLYNNIKNEMVTIRKKNINKKLNYSANYTSDNYNIYESIINKYKRAEIIWPLPKEIKFRPYMGDFDLKNFLYFMKSGNIYFEFGSGGSTNIASFYKVKTYSVESDVKWHEKLKNNGIAANYITIDLHVTSLGYPGNDTNVNDWKKYIQAYKKEYNADIILIDGRFRVACALDIFSKIRNDTLIFIHDYKNRRQYYILERYYIKLKVWDRLALFIKNTNINSINVDIYNKFLKEKFI